MAEMTDEKWNAIKTKIELWFDNHEDWEDTNLELLSVPNLVKAGDAKPSKRIGCYSGIRTCFSDILDKPSTFFYEEDEDDEEHYFEMRGGGICTDCYEEDWNDPRNIEDFCEWCGTERAITNRMNMDKKISLCGSCVHHFE